ncbi:uncharacterized protein EHS24_005269 [Apiotrichum porosum]|uniref:Ricin B lectin domain-containing protein n=1 Tax=Apiotrichum porosum TaxID=105984 RepID=A0A427XDQ7_9TREE|nr:uncharacterized protein EHS24_005269 [Apiotrichum porosum]RSH76867.1 hypothetical protein EHS24_005269 [Apiotrichum porosum]
MFINFAILAAVAATSAMARPTIRENVGASGVQPVQWQITAPDGSLKCLDVKDGALENGTPVQLWDCIDGNTNQIWTKSITSGIGPIELKGTPFCLDAGDNPGDQSQLRIWDCYSGLPQQQFKVQGDTLQVADKNLCVDVPVVSIYEDGTSMQVFTCFANNDQQKWTPKVVGPTYWPARGGD